MSGFEIHMQVCVGCGKTIGTLYGDKPICSECKKKGVKITPRLRRAGYVSQLKCKKCGFVFLRMTAFQDSEILFEGITLRTCGKCGAENPGVET